MIRNHTHLIPTNEKFTEKFTEKFNYDNIIPTTTKLPESVAPLQTVNLPKPSNFIDNYQYIETQWNQSNLIRTCFEKTKQLYSTVLKYVD